MKQDTDNNSLLRMTFAVKFQNKHNDVHVSKCDFDIEHSTLNLKKCPIIAAYVPDNHNVRINSLESVDVNIDVTPQTFAAAVAKCAQCKLKHRERGAD